MLGLSGSKPSASTSTQQAAPSSPSIARRAYLELSASERGRLDGYYVRLRYNDKVMNVPGCRATGSHFPGDESLCTLEAFKRIADSFTPKDWKGECAKTREERVDTSPEIAQWAGGNVDSGATMGTQRSGIEGVKEEGGVAN